MVIIKSSEEIELIRAAGAIAASALQKGGMAVAQGMTTAQIDAVIHEYIISCGAKPSFLGYAGFPAASCISVNEEVIHGIPGSKVIQNGDIVKIDVGAYYGGFHGDCAATFAAGTISEQADRLLKVTKQSFFEGMKFARPGYRIGDIGHAISNYVQSFGYNAVTKYVGHGLGKNLHEDPAVPNFGRAGHGIRLEKGMVLAVEPMINAGISDVTELSDGWTVVTQDGKLSSHYENTIAITDNEPDILTKPFEGRK